MTDAEALAVCVRQRSQLQQQLEDLKQCGAMNAQIFQELQEKYEDLRWNLYLALEAPDLFGGLAVADCSDAVLVAQVKCERRLAAAAQEAIRMLLQCPECFERHIDEGEWVTRPHKVHECQKCGHQFKVCDRPTVGVQFLVPR